ncbi:MAG: hypothetical protein HY738_12980 [Bacteroidia bacterium]|nr:hypothetical protein [Bacteroidia bacterium]
MDEPILTCNNCILSTQDYKQLTFDNNGRCSICNTYFDLMRRTRRKHNNINELIFKIKNSGEKKSYDCIIGVSGGLDSSYLSYLSKQWGLRPLLVHVDGGWNTEKSVLNIENLIKSLNYDLFTYVIDWLQLKDVQRAFFKSSVIDIDLPFDINLCRTNNKRRCLETIR